MRAAVVVGIIALLVGSADAAPKKKRHGTFAVYIDPAALDDPPPAPPPPEREPNALSVVLLVDCSAGTKGTKLDAAKQALLAAETMLFEDDRVAVLAFHQSVDYVLKPTCAGYSARIRRAIKKLEASAGPADLAYALGEASWYIKEAPGRRVIILVTDATGTDDTLDDALRAVREAKVQLIVVGMPDGDDDVLRHIAREAGAPLYTMERGRGSQLVAAEVYDQHFVGTPRSASAPGARSTTGFARSASPPPP